MVSAPTTGLPELYILWHPACPLGERLAERILRWLRPGNGLGPDVYYRSLAAPDAGANGLPPPLPGEYRPGAPPTLAAADKFQLVLPLIDEQLVADGCWRHWLTQLAGAPSDQRVIIPVALDATAYNMPPALRMFNYLRPQGLPLRLDDAAAFERVARSLLKQVTEVMCRLILPRSTTDPAASTSGAPPAKVNLFLSHAKQDGTTPARRLRDYIYSQTQLAAFYDENDIAFGAMFDKVIAEGIGSADTAALIAVRSVHYASRPWCRRELALFRRPRRIDGGMSGGMERWRLYPTLVIEAMEPAKLSAGLPELGNSPVIGWSDEAPDLEELIVTTAVRDAMLVAFHSHLGLSVEAELSRIGSAMPNSAIISWMPDPTTLLRLINLRGGMAPEEIFYPGRGLSGLELDILEEFFPQITFRAFEEVLS